MGVRARKLVTAVAVFAALAGGAAWFLTKPEPTWREAKRYARIALRGDTGWLRNASRAFSILRRAWLRRGIPVETSGKT